MVTKRTGAPRGRPRKHPLPAIKHDRPGRPSVPFLEDPDKYLVALMEAHVMVLGMTDRDAAKITAAIEVGNEIRAPADVVARCPEGMIVFAVGPSGKDRSGGNYINTRAGSRASSVDGRAATIRGKSRDARNSADVAAKKWLASMTFICGLLVQSSRAPFPPRAHAKIAEKVLAEAFEVGERETVANIILPAILAA